MIRWKLRDDFKLGIDKYKIWEKKGVEIDRMGECGGREGKEKKKKIE